MSIDGMKQHLTGMAAIVSCAQKVGQSDCGV